MKLLSKIKAFFLFQDEPAELTVSAAEIRNGKVFLHPLEDPRHVYRIKADAVDIIINPHENIREDDLVILDVKEPSRRNQAESGDSNEHERKDRERSFPSRQPLPYQKQKMKTVQFTLYPDEYEMLMANIKENGYKKTEFLLACVSAAKKKSMETNYLKYTQLHKERRAADREAAKRAKEQSA